MLEVRMTQRAIILISWAGLAILGLPGCKMFSPCSMRPSRGGELPPVQMPSKDKAVAHLNKDQPVKIAVKQTLDTGKQSQPDRTGQPAQLTQVPSPIQQIPTVTPRKELPAASTPLVSRQIQKAPTHLPELVRSPLGTPAARSSARNIYYPNSLEPRPTAETGKPPVLLEEARPGPPKAVGPTLPPIEKKEPLVLAMEKFLQDQPQAAIDHLKAYDEGNQEFFLRLLPVLAQMTSKGLDQLDAQQSAAMYEQLERVMAALRSHTGLAIDQMCFCERIEAYGVYQPLPKQHVFRAGQENQPGELVQIYVQLRNLCPRECEGGYESRLASTVQIHDAAGKQVWFYNLKKQERPLRSQTLRSDYFNNYSFYVPSLPAGSYTLTVEVADLNRPNDNRPARQSLPFPVRAE